MGGKGAAASAWGPVVCWDLAQPGSRSRQPLAADNSMAGWGQVPVLTDARASKWRYESMVNGEIKTSPQSAVNQGSIAQRAVSEWGPW